MNHPDNQMDEEKFTFGKKPDSNKVDMTAELEKFKRKNLTTTFVAPMPEQQADSIGPARPVPRGDNEDSDDSSSDGDDGVERPEDRIARGLMSEKPQSDSATTPMPESMSAFKIPCSHEVLIKGHTKTITALDIDNKGLRMITGSNDYNVRMWDFQGMNRSMNSFRILEPFESQPLVALSYSPDGSRYLACIVGAQAKIFDRDGKELMETSKGDMYISDLSHTRGHVAIVKDGQWHPTENHVFITASQDSTVRIWDINNKLSGIEQHLAQKTVIKCKSAKGVKTGVQTCRYSIDGKYIIAACEDGSLQIWSNKTHYSRCDANAQAATQPNVETTSICCFKNGYNFLTRTQDNSMKLWDTRFFKKPVFAWVNLPNSHESTDIALSPDDSVIVTGSSVKKPDELGLLHFFDAKTYDDKGHFSVSKGSVTSIVWHPILNQIFVGSTDCGIHCYCDPKLSQKGALLCLFKQERKVQPDDMDYTPDIRTPHALPSLKESNPNKKKKLEKIRQDPIITRKPELPLQGPGRGGKMSGPGTVTQFIMLTTNKTEEYKEDAREALLKLDAEAKRTGEYVAQAYKVTQPVPIFDYTTPEVAEQELLSSIQKICPSCGLKICKCGKRKVIYQ
jgi:WD40 repeat protein